ncbi:tetratricopeptide repeat protein [uncultured Selenomonas sp.]|uniref:tetratricopeptide repeat protein n=1 Tax=uncultured Selenomonas sp. TaxID=159275 RepID=UPI0028D0001E|nr:tetratricopeptide repeat protein [uncultured Selenomonas sp.]
MFPEIRLSALILTVLISIALVVGLIHYAPPLTQTYYWRLGGLIAGAGLLVTLFDRLMAARARRRAAKKPPLSFEEEQTALPVATETMTERPAVSIFPAKAAAVPKAPPQPAGKKLTAKKKKAKAHAKKNAAKPALPLAAVPPLTAVPPRVAAPPVKSPPPAPPPAEHLPDGLDALLDIAYASAEPAPERAVAAYRKALARYPQDSYMPYLVIELSTLYKRLGNYDAALRLFDEALALPIIAKNAVMVQEFRRSRRTLHAVSDMLRARGTPALPFGEVPEDVLAAADRQAGNHT